MKTAARFLLGAALAAGLAACAPGPDRPHAPPGPAPVWEGRTPADVLRDLEKRRRRLRAFSAAFSLTVSPPPRGRPSTLRGLLVADLRGETPRVRLQVHGPFGGVVFDMVRDGAATRVYVPARRTLYRGRTGAAPPGGGPLADLFPALLADPARARPRAGTRLEVTGGEVRLPLENGELRLEAATGRLLAWRRAGAVVTYGDYRAPAPG
ncbi:hypothetical protein G3N55_11755, partial [Dissulfurirhabdus thermomarina]